MKIIVSKDGPYLVSGNIPLRVQVITPNNEGFSWEWKDGEKFQAGKEYNLCRCAQSNNKYTGKLVAADVFTESTTFQVMQSIPLDLGHGSYVHP